MIVSCVEKLNMSPREVLNTSFLTMMRMIEEHNEEIKEEEDKFNKEKNESPGSGKGGGFENLVGLPGVDI
ncbi:MAG: hypothetical protein WCS17_12780 [Prevotella sp.]